MGHPCRDYRARRRPHSDLGQEHEKGREDDRAIPARRPRSLPVSDQQGQASRDGRRPYGGRPRESGGGRRPCHDIGQAEDSLRDRQGRQDAPVAEPPARPHARQPHHEEDQFLQDLSGGREADRAALPYFAIVYSPSTLMVTEPSDFPAPLNVPPPFTPLNLLVPPVNVVTSQPWSCEVLPR